MSEQSFEDGEKGGSFPLKNGELKAGESISNTFFNVPVGLPTGSDSRPDTVTIVPGIKTLNLCNDWIVQQLSGNFFLTEIDAKFPSFLRTNEPMSATFTLERVRTGRKGTFGYFSLECVAGKDPDRVIASARFKIFRPPQ